MLECKSVSVTHGKKISALKGISLEVREGEIVALIGGNGAGKSTFLRTVSGLHRSDGGEIQFQGRRIDHMAPHNISALGIAHVPEGRRIFSRLTVLENLELGFYLQRGSLKSALENIFRIFPVLKERVFQSAGTLSGGEQQMLAMGRSLMSNPRLLMLDEPSMGLSPILVERIFDTIRAINGRGVTVLLVEQNAKQSLGIAHRAYVLETGRVVLEGKGADLLENDQIRQAYLGSS
ncbi:MAG: ABC transporter ATP-binding protein [Elusimicrobia bacterium RIFCSPLOWO2_01_FULL_54_10]|nr:MAG: ABC transporter ATP-binding protein [Elusimicrobia bacterium RIFCSPLOWO2_01_FULL_54_10]